MYLVKRIFLFFTAVIFLYSCSSTTKINAFRPEPEDASPLIYDNKPSFISLPVALKIKDIENQTNKFLTGIIYEDNNIKDDDYTITIWKQAPIGIENENGKIKTVLPLKVNVKYRIGTERLGVALYNTQEFNFDGVITLMSSVNLNNWKLKTKTQFKSIVWKESPSIKVFGKDAPITYLINPAVQAFKSKIEKSIDQAIEESMDFKPNVLDALDKIATPSEMSAEYESWLRVVPTELYATEAQIKGQSIVMQMGLKCTIETLIGKQPAKIFDKNKIVLKPVSKMPDNFTANIIAVSTYKDASKIITKNFEGQEFGSGSRKVKVLNVALWHKNDKIVIALDLSGSLTGTIYLTGLPKYNDKTKEIYFDNLDYAVDTKSSLIRTANWLASGLILRKMEESCRYSLQPNLEDGKKTMLNYLSNFSPMPGVFVNGKMGTITFTDIQLTNKAILAFLTVDGKVAVKVDGLE
ncbi:DUF4403 domain-containing protein [Flavobacterium antarcticum]|uniref:DUF4403 family protein n=1 Tax=Flavobacterium antarcticum TaxID=271155 RepID=UPI0003B4EA75|nr:DUF4403 family protein [Flavobacterium antarcticum]